MYFVGGWSDTYTRSGLRLFSGLQGPTKVLIGPWGHTYPYAAAQGLDWAHEEIRWWREWLVGERTGIMDEPRLRLFMPAATASEGIPVPGRWIGERQWPPPASQRRLYLNAGALEPEAKPGAPFLHRDRDVVGMTKPEWLDRLPIEQSYDDALSTVFDTAPLDEPLEIAGEPELTLHVAADRPVAKVFVRLCDVRPDGKSWLVTWAALNLTRRESMSEPSPLQPGLLYAVTIPLRPAAYAFGAGSRLRLAISEGFWPMLWPSPEIPTLSLPTGVSTLSLPVRSARQTEAEFPVPQQAGVEPAPDYRPATPDPTGRIVLANNQPPYPYRVAAAGVELSASSEETSEIIAGDPLSCRWRHTSRSAWRSEGRDCAIEASYELTSDASSFRIVETLRASEGGQQVFARESDRRIPRDLM
jgi:predicted acyl esterase